MNNYRLTNADLYVTLEPCLMCAGAIIHARIRHLVFGLGDPKRGAANSTCHAFEAGGINHRVEIASGVLTDDCSDLLQTFFRERR